MKALFERLKEARRRRRRRKLRPRKKAARFKLGNATPGGWGDSIQWHPKGQFSDPYDWETMFHVVGWKTPRPMEGDLLVAEMDKSFMEFVFVEVECMRDPPDMFFAYVRPVSRAEKGTAEAEKLRKEPAL